MLGTRKAARKKRHKRIRKKISGTQAIPRLCVYRSLKHIEAQIIDDHTGKTLVGVSSCSKAVEASGGNRDGATLIGKLLAEKALLKNIKSVVFDRGGYIYHGRVRALAEAAREGGLKF